MEFTAGTVPSLDGSEGWSFPSVQETSTEPELESVPMPVFARRHRRGLHRTAAMASPGAVRGPLQEVHGVQLESGGESSEFWSSSSRSGEPLEPVRKVRIAENVETMSEESSQHPSQSEDSSISQRGDGDDPWLQRDPWQQASWASYEVVKENENYDEQSAHEADRMSWSSYGEQSVHEADRMSGSSGWSGSWSGGSGRYEPDDKWENWSDSSY